MRKVILLFPKITPDIANAEQWTLAPISLLCLATPLIEAGFEVTIIDQRIDEDWRQTLSDGIKKSGTICVGISVMTGYPIKGALEAASIVKQTDPGVRVVFGGVHPSLLPHQTLQSDLVDVVVSGEGEKTFLELVKALGEGKDLGGMPGVFHKDANGTQGEELKNLLEPEDWSRPAYNLVNIENYLNAPFLTKTRPLAMSTSRGCPWRCRYCYNQAFNRRRWRAWSAQRVLEEIDYLTVEYGIDGLFLLDDNFFVSQKRVHDICRGLENSKKKMAFYNANCRIDTIHKYDMEVLDLIKRAGFDKLFVGVESGSDRTLERIQKDITVEQILAANLKLKHAGIIPVYSFMIGFNGETRSDMESTLKIMVQLHDQYPEAVVNPLNIFTPFPGTSMYEECRDSRMQTPTLLEEWAQYDYFKINYRENFASEELQFINTAHYVSNLIDPKLITSRGQIIKIAKKVYAMLARRRIRNGRFSMPGLKIINNRDIHAE